MKKIKSFFADFATQAIFIGANCIIAGLLDIRYGIGGTYFWWILGYVVLWFIILTIVNVWREG